MIFLATDFTNCFNAGWFDFDYRLLITDFEKISRITQIEAV